jgi:hypothetical protein
MSKVLTTIGVNDFDKSATTYRKQLLMMPIQGIQSSLKHMTLRPGIRYAERVGAPAVNVELRPYVPDAMQDANLSITWRELKTYFGSVNARFEPNSAISTILGHLASQASGDALKNVDLAKLVLALIGKQIGQKLNACLFSAVRNSSGTTTNTLFDGFDTITAADHTANKLTVALGNYDEGDTVITASNAESILKEYYRSCVDELRDQPTKMFISRAIYDMYCDSYQTNHGALPYNTEFKKTYIEGSEGLCELVPIVGKANSQYIHITPKTNMLVGVDQMGDVERVNVSRYAPDTLTYEMRMFFGVDFETVDARMFKAIKLAQPSNNPG